MVKLAPSILAADFSKLGEEISLIERSSAEYVHIDIMDGVFVPATSIGAPVVSSIRKYTKKVFDVHLMMQNPDQHIESFVTAGADIITIHAEACTHLHRSIQNIKSYGKKVGVALNPHTPLVVLENILEYIDMVLIMSVNPGFGGQKYIENITKKIANLRYMLLRNNLNIDIEVDGGISLENVEKVINAGASVIVAGSAVFGGETEFNIEKFRKIFDGFK